MQKLIQKYRSLLISSFFIIFTVGSPSAWSQVPEYFNVKLNINQHFSGNSKLLAKDYFKNIAHYNGFRLAAIEVVAGADLLPASIQVLVQKKPVAGGLQLNAEIRSFRLFVTNGLFIGFGAENIVLNIQGGAFVKELNLILAR